MRDWLQNNLKGDRYIWIAVVCLSVISVLVVYSASASTAFRHELDTEFFLFKHITLIAISYVALWVAHLIDYRYYARLSRLALIIVLPLLAITYLYGTNINGASRWLSIPFIGQQVQTSDLAKFALIASLAAMLSKRQLKIENIKEALIPMLLWCGVICGLIALTDFSTACLLFATCMLLMFIGRVPVKYLAMLVFVGALAGSLALNYGQRGETAKNRVISFLNQDEVPYQAQQSYVAIATGKLTGKGPGNSDQRRFLPSPESDFIYAIIIEEWGLLGGLFTLGLYLLILYRGMIVMSQSNKMFGGLLSAGLSFALVLQAIVNMAVVVGLGPITGLPLPFVSWGGSSMLFTGITLGVILSVSRGELNEAGILKKEVKKLSKVR